MGWFSFLIGIGVLLDAEGKRGWDITQAAVGCVFIVVGGLIVAVQGDD